MPVRRSATAKPQAFATERIIDSRSRRRPDISSPHSISLTELISLSPGMMSITSPIIIRFESEPKPKETNPIARKPATADVSAVKNRRLTPLTLIYDVRKYINLPINETISLELVKQFIKEENNE